MMFFIFISFVAGFFTVFAPCVLPLLPVIVGGSLSGGYSYKKILTIFSSLSFSIIVFTLLLKTTTVFYNIPPFVWTYVSATLLVVMGVYMIVPFSLRLFDRIIRRFSVVSQTYLYKGVKREGVIGNMIIGLSLGPVFASCSPTYFLIVSSILPASFFEGLYYLVFYVLGLAVGLLVVLYASVWILEYVFKKDFVSRYMTTFVGVVFILVGFAIAFGLDKKIELSIPAYLDGTKVEMKMASIVEGFRKGESLSIALLSQKYEDFVEPSGFINTPTFSLKDKIGHKVILIDFMNYDCINCIRTLPYLNAWHKKYASEGLLIVAVHTPEFSYQKDMSNVEESLKKYGVEFPVVLDNDYKTWYAYGAKVWPERYLIDMYGYVVYDFKGEGGYEETEAHIKEALKELKQ